ncbi:hypothetical protein D3C75_913920 [compost metagenome]
MDWGTAENGTVKVLTLPSASVTTTVRSPEKLVANRSSIAKGPGATVVSYNWLLPCNTVTLALLLAIPRTTGA